MKNFTGDWYYDTPSFTDNYSGDDDMSGNAIITEVEATVYVAMESEDEGREVKLFFRRRDNDSDWDWYKSNSKDVDEDIMNVLGECVIEELNDEGF